MRRVRQSGGLRTSLLCMCFALGLSGASPGFAADGQATTFKVLIESISRGNVLQLPSGGDAPVVMSPVFEDG